MPAPLLLLLLLLQLALLPPASPYTPPYTWSFQSILTAADSNNQTSTEGLVPAHLLGRGFMSIITGRGNASALSRSAAPPPPSLPGLYVHTNDYGYAARGTNVWSQQGILIPSDLYIDHLYDSAKYPPPSLTPPPPQPPRGYGDSQFGKWMVSEGTQIIVGSPLKDAGAVYVFNGTLRHWSQTQILVPKDPDFFTNYNQDRFGEYLALEGARLIVGAPGKGGASGPQKSPLRNIGAAYVFEKSPKTHMWSQQEKLVARDGQQELEQGVKSFSSLSVHGDWVVGNSRWDNPSISHLCSQPLVSGAKTIPRECKVEKMSGSAYLFKLTPGIGWSQQQKLISDPVAFNTGFQYQISPVTTDIRGNQEGGIIQAVNCPPCPPTANPCPIGTCQQRLNAKVFGNEVKLVTPAGSDSPLLAVAFHNNGSSQYLYEDVYLFGLGQGGTRWSLQQTLFATSLGDTSDAFPDINSPSSYSPTTQAAIKELKYEQTRIFVNTDTIIANTVDFTSLPYKGTSYVFRFGYLAEGSGSYPSWSLQQVLRPDLPGTNGISETANANAGGATMFINPSIRGGTIVHGSVSSDGTGRVVTHSRFTNGSCLLFHLTDHFGDGWDTALLSVVSPDRTNDTFSPHCDQPDPFLVRYCPYQPEDTGTYIVKVFGYSKARFFWEISWRAQVEGTGQWYLGDYSTKMRFSFDGNSSAFSFYDAENLLDPILPSVKGDVCNRCSRITTATWQELQTVKPSFFPVTVWNSVYYISSYEARDLYASGRVCAGIYKWTCYQTLPDGVYILRLGTGPLGRDIGYPYGTGGWAGCGTDANGKVLQGGFRDQLIFSVVNGVCRVLRVTTYPAANAEGGGVAGCIPTHPQVDPYAAMGGTAPTSGGTAAPTKGVFGPEYDRYHMYSLEGDRTHSTYTRDSTGALVDVSASTISTADAAAFAGAGAFANGAGTGSNSAGAGANGASAGAGGAGGGASSASSGAFPDAIASALAAAGVDSWSGSSSGSNSGSGSGSGSGSSEGGLDGGALTPGEMEAALGRLGSMDLDALFGTGAGAGGSGGSGSGSGTGTGSGSSGSGAGAEDSERVWRQQVKAAIGFGSLTDSLHPDYVTQAETVMGRKFLSPSLLPSATPSGQASNAANANANAGAGAGAGSLTGSSVSNSGSNSGSRNSGNPHLNAHAQTQTSTPSLLEETLKELLLEESYPLDMVTDSTGTAYEGGWEGQGWEGGDADALFADFKGRNRGIFQHERGISDRFWAHDQGAAADSSSPASSLLSSSAEGAGMDGLNDSGSTSSSSMSTTSMSASTSSSSSTSIDGTSMQGINTNTISNTNTNSLLDTADRSAAYFDELRKALDAAPGSAWGASGANAGGASAGGAASDGGAAGGAGNLDAGAAVLDAAIGGAAGFDASDAPDGNTAEEGGGGGAAPGEAAFVPWVKGG